MPEPRNSPPPVGNRPRARGTFRALRHPYYRILWAGILASAVGTWMQIVAQSLLVLRITGNSAVALGTVSLAQASAFFLFAPLGGTVLDRLDKRRLLFRTQTLLMLAAFSLAVLTATGAIRLWMVIVLAFSSGVLLSFDQPARAALLPSLAPPEDLTNAVSLQVLAFNAASIAGPPLGGAVAAVAGLAGDFAFNGCSYAAVLLALLLLPKQVTPAQSSARPRTWTAIREMLAVLRRKPGVPSTMVVYAVLLFAAPSLALLVPVFVTKVLGGGAGQVGLLFAASGIGTVLGSLFVASFGDTATKQRLIGVANAVWLLALAGFAMSRTFGWAFATLILLAAAQSIFSTLVITLMQSSVDLQMRGRVMSLNTLLNMGLRPLGDFPVSIAIALLGVVHAALLSAGVVGLAAALTPSFFRGGTSRPVQGG